MEVGSGIVHSYGYMVIFSQHCFTFSVLERRKVVRLIWGLSEQVKKN